MVLSGIGFWPPHDGGGRGAAENGVRGAGNSDLQRMGAT
jgi:hypothetical protein